MPRAPSMTTSMKKSAPLERESMSKTTYLQFKRRKLKTMKEPSRTMKEPDFNKKQPYRTMKEPDFNRERRIKLSSTRIEV